MTDAPKSVGVKRTTGYADNYWGVLTHIFDDGAVEYTRADLADAEIERLRLSLSEARATGRREGLSEAADILLSKAAGLRANENPTSTAMAMIFEEQAAAIRAAMEKEE